MTIPSLLQNVPLQTKRIEIQATFVHSANGEEKKLKIFEYNLDNSFKIYVVIAGADLAFFQGGGGLTQRRCGASSTSHVAASRFFCYFEPP